MADAKAIAVPNARTLGTAVRVLYIAITIMLGVYVGYSSVHNVIPDYVSYGGAQACFACDNGWNWHVILMSLAFGVISTESILAFKAPLVDHKPSQMWVHLAAQTLVGVVAVIGLVAIIQAKIYSHSDHMYSVHAWTGAIALLLYFLQYVVGLLAFVVFKRGLAPHALRVVTYWHAALGKLTFFAGIGCCINGWADIQMMMMSGQPTYGSATLLASASAVAYWGLSACMCQLMLVNSPAEEAALRDARIAAALDRKGSVTGGGSSGGADTPSDATDGSPMAVQQHGYAA
ncbi:eukaryotic cytochrome b561-domain-containing protein [Tribonema minus]|uniref:Eukaryotic cytochrome b561-domain-containing protein n=1 Tax=Tribonema minus TaxID=303371 RepID=A0A836C9Q2_9STRA|nr:eukaryotic cytochrome b561-domain-containing protein [Tribonema minus]